MHFLVSVIPCLWMSVLQATHKGSSDMASFGTLLLRLLVIIYSAFGFKRAFTFIVILTIVIPLQIEYHLGLHKNQGAPSKSLTENSLKREQLTEIYLRSIRKTEIMLTVLTTKNYFKRVGDLYIAY